ncbi:MAG: hypothetical protein CMQ41_13190 [Gammaproteobacteria bacterium]|nr:hypothetical protein [Gammaproteobacteria bacterium]|tara:strand:- start:107 stop:1078 length:972 start_codon:yes stop_codon:yes gene_type:complete
MKFESCLLLLIASSAVAATSFAQITAWDKRTIDDQPDLQGVWGNNTITPVERPDRFGNRQFLTNEEQTLLQRRISEITQEDGDALFGDGVFEAAFSGETVSYDPSTGNYDQSWLVERSVHNRTSQIIEPLNGKFPPRAEDSSGITFNQPQRGNTAPSSWTDLTVDDRCISYGAPYLNSGYNSYWQIVQSRDHIIIVQEMMHDVRIFPLSDKPQLDEKIQLWHGDSRAFFDGDTLVVETSNFSNKSSFGHNRSKKNIERFTRLNENQLLYQITIDQPDTYSTAFTREFIMDYTPEPIYEYACHEGNYSMTNMLRGARVQEENIQ